MDVILALVIAGCQALATWLAWRATADPIKSHQHNRKKRYSFLLGLSCVVAFGATGFVTYKARDVSTQLDAVHGQLASVQNQLGDAQKRIRDISENFVVADIPKSEIEKDEIGPEQPMTNSGPIAPGTTGPIDKRFEVEKVEAKLLHLPTPTVGLTVYIKNVGPPVKNFSIYSNMTVAESATRAETEKKLINSLSHAGFLTYAYRVPENTRYEIPMYVRKNERFWFEQLGPSISSDMFAGLKEGKYSIYFVGTLGSLYSYCYFVSGDTTKVHNCTPAPRIYGMGGPALGSPE